MLSMNGKPNLDEFFCGLTSEVFIYLLFMGFPKSETYASDHRFCLKLGHGSNMTVNICP